jgi:hypothetical protein
MKRGYILIISLIFLIILMNGCLKKETPKGIVCAQDAKQCPDGSYVSRIAPNCDFAVCPEIKNYIVINNRTIALVCNTDDDCVLLSSYNILDCCSNILCGVNYSKSYWIAVNSLSAIQAQQNNCKGFERSNCPQYMPPAEGVCEKYEDLSYTAKCINRICQKIHK